MKDVQLIEGYLAGESWAFHTVQRWIRSVYYANFGSKYADFMDDVAQDVHIELLRILLNWRGECTLSSFVKQTVKYRARDIIRLQEGKYVGLTRDVADTTHTGKGTISNIPIPSALVLVEQSGMSYQDVADMLGISRNAVRLRVRRARRRRE